MGGCRFRVKLSDQPDRTKWIVGATLTISFGFLDEETWQTLVTELRSLSADQDQVILGLSFKMEVETETQRAALEFLRGIITSLLD
jgi:hypothetical protein